MSYDITPSSQDGTLRYLCRIGETPLLTPAQERALMARVKAGDQEAHERFIVANLRLVAAIAKKFMLRGLDYDDLVQLGNLGLLKAVEKFDLDRNTKFSTYAVPWIRQSIQRALDDQVRVIRLPVHLSESTRMLRKAFNYFDHIPSRQELADALGWTIAKVDTVLASSKDVRSLDAAIGEADDPTCLSELVGAPVEDFSDGVMQAALVRDLEIAMKDLSERERAILQARYGEKLTLEETGKRHSITRERARQIERDALDKLRRIAPDLRGYLEAA